MLHEFLTANREELIRRCRSKVRKRDSPPVTSSELEYGVPLFLEQLVEALRCEQAATGHAVISGPWNKISSAESSRTAALHGEELLAKGYTVDQVVHGYGDVCQAITELASEKNAPVTVNEFHTFNRLLDNAIADAVSSYGRHRDASLGTHAEDLHERMGTLADEQRALLETALKALQALKLGNIGLKGATGTLLEESLVKLRDLVDKSLPEIRLATGMTTPPKAGQSS
ncbi:MAG TPA: hypothetical protein VGX52_07970 [Burkholderiales bacterium]|nr:hypothetical protein [Burkholderiales bacterium]